MSEDKTIGRIVISSDSTTFPSALCTELAEHKREVMRLLEENITLKFRLDDAEAHAGDFAKELKELREKYKGAKKHDKDDKVIKRTKLVLDELYKEEGDVSTKMVIDTIEDLLNHYVLLKRVVEDICEMEKEALEGARKVLTEFECYGDSHGTPGAYGVMELLLNRYEILKRLASIVDLYLFDCDEPMSELISVMKEVTDAKIIKGIESGE